MKILINTLFLRQNMQFDSAKMVTEILFSNLEKMSSEYSAKLFLLVSRSNETYWSAKMPDVSLIVVPFKTDNQFVRVIIEQIACNWAINKINADAFYSFSGVLPIFPRSCRTIVYFQNILFFHYHEFYNRKKMGISRLNWFLKCWLSDFYNKRVCINAMKQATEVTAISKRMAFELEKYTGVVRERPIHIIPFGVNDEFYTSALQERPIKELYILSVSSVVPHKNYETCLRIFASLKNRHNVPHKLYIIGNGSSEYVESLVKLSDKLRIKDSVCFKGPLENRDLVKWYKNADAFIATSLCESLGFTVIEAMACGTPVIASNRSGLPDTVSNAGIVEDPAKTDIFADKLNSLLYDQDLRNELIQLGFKRAAEFSCEKAARETMEIMTACSDPQTR